VTLQPTLWKSHETFS